MKKYIVYIVYTSLLFIFGGCDVLDKYKGGETMRVKVRSV